MTVAFCLSGSTSMWARRVLCPSGDIHLVAAHPTGVPLLPEVGDPVPYLVQPVQVFEVDVTQISWPLPHLALNRLFQLQVSNRLGLCWLWPRKWWPREPGGDW